METANTANTERPDLSQIHLSKGGHSSRESGVFLTEAVAVAVGTASKMPKEESGG